MPKINKICLDASIIAKLLTKEEKSRQASQAVELLVKEGTSVIEPEFLQIEIYSVIRKKWLLNELSRKHVHLALDLFYRLPLSYRKETKQVLDKALEISEQTSLRVIYDCIYLALAMEENATFCTADRSFLKKALQIYKPTLSLRKLENSI